MIINLQDHYAPNSICFGCGPSNPHGLQIKSFCSDNEEIHCHWTPKEHHQAFPGILNGGIIGAILDCHSNWSAAYHLMNQKKLNHPPCTVTASFSVVLKRPTPMKKELFLKSKLISLDHNRAMIDADLFCEEKLCATCKGEFVAVKEGHPAFHRWN